MKRSILLILLTSILIFTMFPFASFAKEIKYDNTLNFATVNKDTSGPGFVWQNAEAILTIKNLNVITNDEYAITLPPNSIVIIEGTNYLKAKTAAVWATSAVSFEGTGSITLVSESRGVFSASKNTNDIVRFRSGKFQINAPYGIYTEDATVSFAGAEVNIESSKNAVRAHDIQMSSGKINSVGSYSAEQNILISGTNLSASAPARLLFAKNSIQIRNCKIHTGATLESLNPAESYNGENALKLISTVENKKSSVIFGENAPSWLDGFFIFILIVVICAIVAVPLIIKYKKTQKLKAIHAKMVEARTPKSRSKKRK